MAKKEIQWFPGHMAKTFRQVKENIKYVDVVFQLVDARAPISTINPTVQEIIGDKKMALIITKSDLVDKRQLSAFLSYFKDKKIDTFLLDARDNSLKKIVSNILKKINVSNSHTMTRILLIGVPNVGKSTLLNHLAAKNIVVTANRAGVTKKINWLKVSETIQILDTPGVLWPKFEDQDLALKLAIIGSIKDTIFPFDDAALFLIEFLKNMDQSILESRYHLESNIKETNNIDLLMQITQFLGFKEDYEKASIRIVNDFRKGKLGNKILDFPELSKKK